jgi:hypothetical protein
VVHPTVSAGEKTLVVEQYLADLNALDELLG